MLRGMREAATRILLFGAAALIVVSLFLDWAGPDGGVLFGALDLAYENGWERLGGLDIALALLAVALAVAAAVARRPRPVALVLAAACVVAVAAVLIGGLLLEPDGADRAVQGPLVALAGLALGIVALAPLVRRPRRTTL